MRIYFQDTSNKISSSDEEPLVYAIHIYRCINLLTTSSEWSLLWVRPDSCWMYSTFLWRVNKATSYFCFHKKSRIKWMGYDHFAPCWTNNVGKLWWILNHPHLLHWHLTLSIILWKLGVIVYHIIDVKYYNYGIYISSPSGIPKKKPMGLCMKATIEVT